MLKAAFVDPAAHDRAREGAELAHILNDGRAHRLRDVPPARQQAGQERAPEFVGLNLGLGSGVGRVQPPERLPRVAG